MKRILKYVWRYKILYIIPIVSMFIAIGLDMFNPIVTQKIIDDVIRDGRHEILNTLLLGFFGITIGRAIFGYIREFLFDYAGSKVTLDIRKDLFGHIQKLPFDYFDGVNTGEIMSRTTEDVNNIWNAMGFAILFFIEQILYIIIATTMLFTIDWKLAIICLLTMPPMLLLAVKLEKKIGEAYENLSDQSAVLNTTAQENLSGVRLVKAFGREKHEMEKFFKQNEENYRLNIQQAKVWSKYHPVIEFMSNLVLIVVISIGGMFVVGSQISLGELVKFNGYIMMLIWPMRLMGWLTNLIARCNASAKRIFAIIDTEPTITSPENPVMPKELKGHIVFENVSFKYRDEYVLKNINIDAAPGSTVAIMGTTGSGKSSIINLIGRYYDCTEGNILVDGVDVKKMDLKELRDEISVVMQDTFLFSDTIEENIIFSVDDVTPEEFKDAARDAQVEEFVGEMEEGYQTIIGERGVGLSGGQKQRISIARAILKKSKVLIFDDATSALDMETEYNIQKALEKRKEMTKFIIAHRISAVKNADEIIIVENGEIVERGNHKSLIWKKGRYYDIYCEQFKDIDSLQEEVI
ncbi:ABC transporter ATP-binding protein [Alkalicella caledoniensis]|uniref:ABC transporter ATP-binding protein n=1 Tax=Alkalicella caledoniensis TaxID=2731377 RepID=A0A7G9W7E7_ALKCA|nr:ABC transporter ATP-binding protein [Alkalicella caledoniensis]QNO14609.1 ABC transporter ATP-binding protein [Alkalicella caledoniensis]